MPRTQTEVQGIARVSDGLPAILPERRHELWQPDFEYAANFDLPTPVNLEMVQAAALVCWKEWLPMMARDFHAEPISAPRVVGPMRIPDYDKLDLARYSLVCRWRQTEVMLLTLDEAEALHELEYPTAASMYSEHFKQMARLSQKPLGVIEREARQQKDYEKVAEAERAHHDELRRKGILT